jgi:hypothetical protein
MLNRIIILGLLIMGGVSCTKGPGPGGRATIKGRIFAKNLGSSLTVITDSGYLGNQNVYLSYGNNQSVADRVETSFTGDFEFLYLRPGDYTVFTYSKIPYGIDKLDSTVVLKVTIDDKNAVKDLGTIRIYTDKN